MIPGTIPAPDRLRARARRSGDVLRGREAWIGLVFWCGLSACRASSGAIDRSPLEAEQLTDNCKGGEPRLDPSLEPTQLIVREGYALRHSRALKVPLFVCEHVEAKELGVGERPSGWKADPLLPKGERAEDADYKGSGYSRGHMAPNADFVDPDRKKETFFLSNAVPQNQQNNAGIWATLEGQVRDWAKRHATGAWVFSGPIFAEHPATVGAGQVAVPARLYKIVIVEDGGQKALAWIYENQPYERPFDLAKSLVSIDTIEAQTGIDFMPGAEVDGLESTQPAALWP